MTVATTAPRRARPGLDGGETMSTGAILARATPVAAGLAGAAPQDQTWRRARAPDSQQAVVLTLTMVVGDHASSCSNRGPGQPAPALHGSGHSIDQLRLSLAEGSVPIGRARTSNGQLVAPGTPVALLETPVSADP